MVSHWMTVNWETNFLFGLRFKYVSQMASLLTFCFTTFFMAAENVLLGGAIFLSWRYSFFVLLSLTA
jgi:hypothetical protein